MSAKTRSGSKSKQEVLDALSGIVTVSSPSPSKSRTSTGQDGMSSVSYSGQAPMAVYEATPSVPTKDHHFDPLGSGASKSRSKESSAAIPPAPPSKGMNKFSNAFKRQTTEEKEAKRREKEKRMNKAIDDSTMKSSRMDIIDRMDLSGIHGNSLFHHDSPYDACSPHSNRNSRRAPVMAFDHTIDPMTGQPIGMRATNRPGLSPLAAATMRKMDDSAAVDLEEPSKQRPGQSRGAFSGPIPTLRMDSSSSASTNLMSPSDDGTSLASHSTLDRDVEAERAFRQNKYYNTPSNVSKGRSDVSNPNADIWGVSSEPWQDFASPAGGTSGGLRPRDSRGNGRTSGESGSGSASAASSIFDMEAVMTGKKPTSPKIDTGNSSSTDRSADGAPKRSKSLIKKIRSARQHPNVPPPQVDEVELGNMNLNGESTGRARASSGSVTRRPGHVHSPSSPPLQQRGVSSPNMRVDGSLGRSGTLKAGQGDSYYQRGQTNESSHHQSSGLGRNSSIFGRLLAGKAK